MTEDRRGLFDIMDGIIEQVNAAKTVFTILIAVVMIPLIALTAAFVAFDVDGEYYDEYYGDYYSDAAFLFDTVLFLIILIVVGFAIRQLVILNRWTGRYRRFKEKQRELERRSDEELDS